MPLDQLRDPTFVRAQSTHRSALVYGGVAEEIVRSACRHIYHQKD
jgi:hypothetical protein